MIKCKGKGVSPQIQRISSSSKQGYFISAGWRWNIRGGRQIHLRGAPACLFWFCTLLLFISVCKLTNSASHWSRAPISHFRPHSVRGTWSSNAVAFLVFLDILRISPAGNVWGMYFNNFIDHFGNFGITFYMIVMVLWAGAVSCHLSPCVILPVG